MPRSVRLYIGVLFIVLPLAWKFFIFPLLDVMSVPNYSVELRHDENNRFNLGGDWSGKTFSLGRLEISTQKATPGQLDVNTSFSATSVKGEQLFTLKHNFLVDRHSRTVLPSNEDPAGGSYFTFPRHVKKTSYALFLSTFGEPINFNFIDEQEIRGLLTYHFRGQAEKINDTPGYDFLPLVPETYYVYSSAVVDIYVEPFSGRIVDYSDRGVSYYTDEKLNRIWDIASWGNQYDDASVGERVILAQEKMRQLSLYENGVSLALFVVAMIFLSSTIRLG